MCIISPRYILLIIFGVFSMQLISCSSDNRVDASPVPLPTSTISPFFSEPATSTPFQTDVTTPTTIPTRRPKPTVVEDSTPTAVPIDDRYTSIDLYNGQLLSNWTLKNSVNMTYRDNFKGYSFTGKTSIAATPDGNGQLLFSILPTSKVSYKRDEVAGVSFWISSVDEAIAPQDFAVTVLGSNDYPYWDAKDTSVKIPGRVTDGLPVFSETRLYYLNFNRPIEPKTWAEVVVWLDDLIYEPDYTYVTGIYLKNDEQFQKTFYIDKVSLILYAKK